MLLPAALLPESWLWGLNGLALLLLVWTLLRMPWSYVLEAANHNVLFGFSVVLLMLWSIKAGTGLDPRVHVLGATAFTLMFGWQMAVVGMSLVLLGITINGTADWMSYSANALTSIYIPVLCSVIALKAVERYLPKHFFVYIFVAAFFGAAFAYAASALSAYGLLSMAGASPDNFFDRYLPVVLLLMFGEAWINGMAITVFVVMRPHWVVTFDDDRYLVNK